MEHAKKVAETAAELARTAVPGDYKLAVKECWNLAASAYKQAGDEEASREAALNAIGLTLAMADTVTQSSGKAHWVKQALREYRARGDAREKVDELRQYLRTLQDISLDEFTSIPVELEGIEEVRNRTYEEFRSLDLTDSLRAIVGFSKPDDVEQLKAAVLQQARNFPLSNMFATSYADHEGREIARGPSIGFNEHPTEAWYKEHGIQYMRVVRRFRVHGNIEPARQAIFEQFSISQHHLLPIVQMSSFIPPGHHQIFLLGFARLWQGDYVTACHLLIPQVENSLRHVLQMSGSDVSKIEEDGIEGDRPLNILLSSFRTELERILGVDMVWEIDSLLNTRPGPALRHELAHGKLPWGGFFADEAISACWMVYLLTVVPLLRYWDSHVGPAIKSSVSTADI